MEDVFLVRMTFFTLSLLLEWLVLSGFQIAIPFHLSYDISDSHNTVTIPRI